jgi:hypothetical protein
MAMRNELAAPMPSADGAEPYRDVRAILVFCAIGFSISIYIGIYMPAEIIEFLAV